MGHLADNAGSAPVLLELSGSQSRLPRILQLPLPYNSQSRAEILIMIIKTRCRIYPHRPQNDGPEGFRWWSIAARYRKCGGLGRLDGVEHHGKVPLVWILHAYGDVHPAGGQPVLLVFHGRAPTASHKTAGHQIAPGSPDTASHRQRSARIPPSPGCAFSGLR